MNRSHVKGLARILWAPVLPFLAIACSNSVVPPVHEGGPGIEVKVAPLELPGIARACYDVIVNNELGQKVWTRGSFGQSWPVDKETLCSTQFGNGPGGDIAYVGPCDADEPNHTVLISLDGLYNEANEDIGGYVNPCPAASPCTLPVLCTENADTPVTFNFTIMRAANQGFFDVAVNFDNIFCSAKVDCTYDAEGDEPIELLFDPDTGEPTQTAVVGFACTAGPGTDASTTLLMNDLRVTCGDPGVTLMAGFDVFACTDDGAEFYGIVQSVTTQSVSFKSAVWTRAPGTGHYAAGPVTFTQGPANHEAIPLHIVDGANAVGMVAEFGPMVGADPISAILNLQPAVLHKTAAATWEMTQLLPHHVAAGAQLGMVRESPFNHYILTRDSFDQDAPGAQFFVYPKTGGAGTWQYGAPILLDRSSIYEVCDYGEFTGSKYVINSCENILTGDIDILVWDVTSAPAVGPQGGLVIDAAVMPLVKADFALFEMVGTPSAPQSVAVQRIENIWDAGALPGDGTAAGPDRVFAAVNLELVNGSYFNSMVHFELAGGTWTKTTPFVGQDALPSLGGGADANASYSNLELVYETGGQGLDIVIGGANFGGSYRTFVATYERGVNAWKLFDKWQYDSGGGAYQNLYNAWPRVIFTDKLGNHFVAGEGRRVANDVIRPWIAPLGADPATPIDVTFLPFPVGFELVWVEGSRGASTGDSRRLSATVTSVDNGVTQVRAAEWRFDAPDTGGLNLAGWFVFGPTSPLEYDPNNGTLNDRSRESYLQSPIMDTASARCPQFFDRFENVGGAGPFEETALVVDMSADTADLDAVSLRASLEDEITGALSGVLIERAPVQEPTPFLPPANPDAVTLLNPALSAEGNAWTASTPKPDAIPDHIRQVGSYHGEESLLCAGQPCNKLYWNTAIAFDPTVPDCVLSFEATAANTTSLVGGQIPPNTTWPLIIGRVPLTGPAGDDGLASLECRQHPLNTDELYTIYKPGDFDFDLCYGFGASGANPTMSDLGCDHDALFYLYFDFMLQGAGDEGGP